jgi:hypothetical protein
MTQFHLSFSSQLIAQSLVPVVSSNTTKFILNYGTDLGVCLHSPVKPFCICRDENISIDDRNKGHDVQDKAISEHG